MNAGVTIVIQHQCLWNLSKMLEVLRKQLVSKPDNAQLQVDVVETERLINDIRNRITSITAR